MKKIIYNLRVVVIGIKKFSRILFRNFTHLDTISSISINNNRSSNDIITFSMIFKDILFRLQIDFYDTIKEMLNSIEESIKLDLVLLLIDIRKLKNIKKYKKKHIERINQQLKDKLDYVLIGVNQGISKINQENIEKMIERSKKLNILYCFLLEDMDKDLKNILKKLMEDFIFNFKYGNPELFELAEIYGREIQKSSESILQLE